MTLPAKAQWKAVSDKEVASLNKNNVYTLLPVTSVPAGHTIIGNRWVYKDRADNSHKRRVVVLGWGQSPVIVYSSTFASVCRLQSIRVVLVMSAEYNLERWQLDYNTAFLNADVTKEVYVTRSRRIRGNRRKRNPTGNEALEKPIRPMVRAERIGGTRSTNIWWKLAAKNSNRTPASTPTRRAAPFLS